MAETRPIDPEEDVIDNLIAEGVLKDPDAEKTLDLNTDIAEVNGVVGNSLWELRDGETFEEFNKRDVENLNRNIAFLWHCYRQSDGNWLVAYKMAPRYACLGAICANGWLEDMELDEFEEIADLLPLDSVLENQAEYEALCQASPFYSKYSASIAETLCYLIEQYPEQGATWALETIYDEVRKAFAINRILGANNYAVLDAAVSKPASEGGEAPDNTKPTGIADVDENWQPISIMAAPIPPDTQEVQEQLSQAVSELASKAGIELDDEGLGAEAEWPDDEVLELLLLQAYIWGDRSWNKAPEIANDIAFGAVQYARAMFGPKPDLGELSQDERAARLEEIASELMNEDGVVELRIDEGKEPIRQGESISYPLDDISNEFMRLIHEQEAFQAYDRLIQTASKYSENLPACHDNIHAIVLEEMVGYLEDATDPNIGGLEFNEAAGKLEDYTKGRIAALDAKAKSRWKKYLKSNPEAALAAKRKEAIVESDENGNPIFVSQVVQAAFETEEGLEDTDSNE